MPLHIDSAAITRRNTTSRHVQARICGPASISWTGSSDCTSSLVKRSVITVSRQFKLVARARREMTLDVGGADLGKRRRPPARRVVLIDDHGAHAFIKIVAFDDARHYAE